MRLRLVALRLAVLLTLLAGGLEAYQTYERGYPAPPVDGETAAGGPRAAQARRRPPASAIPARPSRTPAADASTHSRGRVAELHLEGALRRPREVPLRAAVRAAHQGAQTPSVVEILHKVFVA